MILITLVFFLATLPEPTCLHTKLQLTLVGLSILYG